MMWLYMLRCCDGSYYTGVTYKDPSIRAAEHNQGVSKKAYTLKRRPVELVFCQSFESHLQAIELERQIKRWSRAKKEALIDGDFNRLKYLSRCRQNDTKQNIAI